MPVPIGEPLPVPTRMRAGSEKTADADRRSPPGAAPAWRIPTPYLYGDEPAEPAEPRRATPTPTSNGDGRGEPRNVRATASASPTPGRSMAGSRIRPPRPGRGDRRPRGPAGPHRPLDARADRRRHPGNLGADGPRPLTTPAARGRDSPGLGVGDRIRPRNAGGPGMSWWPSLPTTTMGDRSSTRGRRRARIVSSSWDSTATTA